MFPIIILVPSTEIAEWRTKTLKLAHTLRPTNAPQALCRDVAAEIMWLLEALEIRKPNTSTAARKTEREKLQTQWETLCTDAFELTMILRNHKDEYRCEFPQEGSVLQSEDTEAQAAEQTHREKKKAESEELIVVYALSGALVRYPADDPGRRIVLQKAWAVVEE